MLASIDFDALDPSHPFIHEGRLLGAADRLQFDTMDSPPEFSVLVGEICYNLRASLDYLVYELAIEDSGSAQEGTQFPIEDSPEGFARRKDPKDRRCYLQGVKPAHIAMIEELQPYNGCEWSRVLREISNPDKHRTLTVTGSHQMGFVKFFTTPPVETEGWPVRRARFRGVEVYAQYPVSLLVLFPDRSGVIKTLSVLQGEVTTLLEVFKPEFK